MKKYILICLVIFILASCAPKADPQLETAALYTEAAKTVVVQMTQNALLTPSVTPTLKPSPTLPPTSTPLPSPTPIPPTPTWVVAPPGKVTAPIFTYIRIAGSAKDDANFESKSNLIVAPDKFAQQMQLLKMNGYSTITVSYLGEILRKGGSLPPRPVLITFDNCAIGVYTKAFPVMKSLGMVATIYVVANMIDGGWMCSSDQIKELVSAGWEIGSKGMTGVALAKNYPALSVEIAGSKAKIKEKIGVEPMSFSYPYGYNDEVIGSRVPEWGYTTGVGVFDSNDHTMNTLFYLARHDVKKSMKLEDFAAMLPWAPEIMPAAPTATSQVQETPVTPADPNSPEQPGSGSSPQNPVVPTLQP